MSRAAFLTGLTLFLAGPLRADPKDQPADPAPVGAPGGLGSSVGLGALGPGGGDPTRTALTDAVSAEVGGDSTRALQLTRRVAPIFARFPEPNDPERGAKMRDLVATVSDPAVMRVVRRVYGAAIPDPAGGGPGGAPGVPGGSSGGAGDGGGPGGGSVPGGGGAVGAGGLGGAVGLGGAGPGGQPGEHPGGDGRPSVGDGTGGGPSEGFDRGSGRHARPVPGASRRWEERRLWGRHYTEVVPDDPAGHAEYGTIEYYSGNAPAAFSSLGNAIELGDRSPTTIATYGRAAYQLGDYGLAERSGQAALELDPSNRDADALVKLARGRTSKVTLPSALSALGALGDAGGGPGAAGAAARANLAAAPSGGGEAAAPYAGGGSSGRTAAELAAAAAALAKAPPSKVQQSAALTREAAMALTVKDYEAAHAIASKAIDINPQNAQAWNYRAIADNKLSRYPDAVYDSSFALSLAPGNAPALQSRSWAFSKQKQYKEGLADANYTLEKEPENGFAYQNRAFALAGMGDREGALAALRRSAELDERFKPKLEAALQAPEDKDLLFLFDEEPSPRPSAPSSPAARKNRFIRMILLSMTGGLLVSLGLLHIVSARFREGVQATMRRFSGASGAASAEGAAAAGSDGPVLSAYEVLRAIGNGGMGVVYEGRDTALDRRVAIKKMRDEIRLDPAERRRFIQEARTVATLHHPNIVDIYAILEDAGDVYLVFEFVSGTTVTDRLRQAGALSFDGARPILKGACEAVAHAHRHGVIHRDLKPSNIMLSEDGAVKVMDFGVARQAKEAMTKMAMTNTIVGTPPYMAPEQEQGTVRKESDVFSLGVCFYEMLTGELPFAGQGAGMLLNKINGRVVPASQRVPGLPAGLDAVLAKALSPDPDKRYATPQEFHAAVEALSATHAA